MRHDARPRRSIRSFVGTEALGVLSRTVVRVAAVAVAFSFAAATPTATAQESAPADAPVDASTVASSAVGYAGPGPDGRHLWLWLETVGGTGRAHGLLRSAAPRLQEEGPAYDVAFSGTVRADAEEPRRLDVAARAAEPSDLALRTDPSRADAPMTELAVRVETTPWTDPPEQDPHGRAHLTVTVDGVATEFVLPAVATRLSSATRLDDASFEVVLDLPFFYAEPYASLDLSAPHFERAQAAWSDGLRQRRELPTAATGGWWLARTDEVRSLTPRLVSVLTHVHAYSGGAHPNAWSETRTWIRDAVNAPWRRAGHVCAALAALERPCDEARMRDEVIRDLERQEAHGVTSGEVGPNAPWLLDAFTLGPGGVTFHFAPYEVGPYVQGPFDVLVRY